MSNSVIKVESLGKKFIISHQRQERYTALRDVIANNARSFLLKTKSIASGQFRSDKIEKEEFWALKDINFDIKQGDRVGIIGRNGAGKSTLLKILSRITEPTEGRIIIRGRVASLLEVGTGFHPELTGRENIFLNGAILGMSRAEIRAKFDEIVAFAEVEKFLDTPVKRYSSGMYVRLAFAVAAHLEPEILIVDEVLAVGDAQFQKKCLGKIEDVSKNDGRTVLFVSHNMGLIAQLCNRGLLLSKGQVEIDDISDVAINKYLSLANKDYSFGYEYFNEQRKKKNYFRKIDVVNSEGNSAREFAFDESVVLNFEFVINNYNPNMQVGIGVMDKFQNRVTTVFKSIDFFRQSTSDTYKGSVSLPAEVFAPNSYSFVLALWARNVEIWDFVENICPIQIHDNGSELSLYEGTDYGSFVIKPVWYND